MSRATRASREILRLPSTAQDDGVCGYAFWRAKSTDEEQRRKTAATRRGGRWATALALDRPADAEFADAGLQRGALHAEKIGCAIWSGDAPFGSAQGAKNVLAFGFFESRDG